MEPSCTDFFGLLYVMFCGLLSVCWCARWTLWTGRASMSVTFCDPLSWRVCSARRESCLRASVRVHEDHDDLS